MELTRGLIQLALGHKSPFSEAPDDLLDLVVEHRMASLLYPSLVSLPGIDRSRLAAIDLLGRHRLALCESELSRIAEIAEAVGISFAVLKGQAHAERWFGDDPAVRRYSDVDLFVDPRNPEGLDRFLVALDPNHLLRGKAGELMSSGVLPDIPVRTTPILIELHANPLSLRLCSTQLEDLWNATESWTTRAGLKLRRFDSTIALLHALINSAKDNHAYLLQVVEIGRAIEDQSIDWARFEQIVTEFRWDAVVGDALKFVCATLELEIPPIRLRPKARDVSVLRCLTPTTHRLGGLSTWRKAQRFAKLDLTVPGQRMTSVLGIASRTFSPDLLIRAYSPDLRGPYLFRAARFWVRRQQYVQGKRSSLSGLEPSERL
jgi:hypothetical protein